MSTKRKQRQVNRREFLKTGARGIAAGALLLTGALLVGRKGSAGGRPSPCPVGISCRSCAKISSCREPKAESFKTGRFWLNKTDPNREKGGAE